MMPVVDKPLIQYAVEEARRPHRADDHHHRRNKRAIEDHFDRVPELEQELLAKASTSCTRRCTPPRRRA